jgi:hypothetical protein
MTDISQQIKTIEEEIRKTPYHKATEHHIGKLRAKISRLKAKQLETSAKKGGGGGYAVKKQGDATVVLVGPPSVGKSTLLVRLTNAKNKIAPYAFTTVSVIPGMMHYKDAKIQILDVPGLIKGAEVGKGRGKEVISVIRAADLLIIMCDVKGTRTIKRIIQSLEKVGIRINKRPPNVVVDRKTKGGIVIHSNLKQDLDKETIKEIIKEFRIVNAEITIKEKLTISTLIDTLSTNRTYVPALFLVNKIDLEKKLPIIDQSFIYVSAKKNIGLEKLKKEIWKKLKLVRVFLVRPTEKPNFNHPLIMKKGNTLKDVAEKISSEFAQEKTRAKIWGKGARYEEQEISLSTKVQEGMQIRFI